MKVVPEQHLRWIEALPLMHVDRHRVYVHAASILICPSPRKIRTRCCGRSTRAPISAVTERDMSCTGITNSGMVPVTIEGRTNLDTQAWYTGRLVIGVFDDEVAGGPVSLLEVHGEPVESKSDRSAALPRIDAMCQ